MAAVRITCTFTRPVTRTYPGRASTSTSLIRSAATTPRDGGGVVRAPEGHAVDRGAHVRERHRAPASRLRRVGAVPASAVLAHAWLASAGAAALAGAGFVRPITCLSLRITRTAGIRRPGQFSQHVPHPVHFSLST